MPLEPTLVEFGAAQGVGRVAQEAAIDFAGRQAQGEQGEQDEQVAEKQAGPARGAWARAEAPGKEHEQAAAQRRQQQEQPQH